MESHSMCNNWYNFLGNLGKNIFYWSQVGFVKKYLPKPSLDYFVVIVLVEEWKYCTFLPTAPEYSSSKYYSPLSETLINFWVQVSKPFIGEKLCQSLRLCFMGETKVSIVV